MKTFKQKMCAVSKEFSFAVLILAFAVPVAAETKVVVYGNGNYTPTTLIVNLYANIVQSNLATDKPLVSSGIKVNFDNQELTAISAQKNETAWFFGDSGAGGATYAYKDPVISNGDATNHAGSVSLIGGKLDVQNPTAGVSGNKVLLGSITFQRQTKTMPFTPSVLSIELANNNGTYANFVTTSGTVLDQAGITFNKVCVLGGDVSGDLRVNMTDFNQQKANWLKVGTGLKGDLNADGRVNMTDFNIMKSEWLKSCP